jgi:hypothetical protein
MLKELIAKIKKQYPIGAWSTDGSTPLTEQIEYIKIRIKNRKQTKHKQFLCDPFIKNHEKQKPIIMHRKIMKS